MSESPTDTQAVVTILTEAKKRIAYETQWFGGGRPRTYIPNEKQQECVAIAVGMVADDPEVAPLRNMARRALFLTLPASVQRAAENKQHCDRWGPIIEYNDTHTHKTVMKWMDRAIKAVAEGTI